MQCPAVLGRFPYRSLLYFYSHFWRWLFVCGIPAPPVHGSVCAWLCRAGIWLRVLPWHGAGVPQHPLSQLPPAVLLFSSWLPGNRGRPDLSPAPRSGGGDLVPQPCWGLLGGCAVSPAPTAEPILPLITAAGAPAAVAGVWCVPTNAVLSPRCRTPAGAAAEARYNDIWGFLFFVSVITVEMGVAGGQTLPAPGTSPLQQRHWHSGDGHGCPQSLPGPRSPWVSLLSPSPGNSPGALGRRGAQAGHTGVPQPVPKHCPSPLPGRAVPHSAHPCRGMLGWVGVSGCSWAASLEAAPVRGTGEPGRGAPLAGARLVSASSLLFVTFAVSCVNPRS